MWEYDPNRREYMLETLTRSYGSSPLMAFWVSGSTEFICIIWWLRSPMQTTSCRKTDIGMLEYLFFCCSAGCHSPLPWGSSSYFFHPSFVLDSLWPFFLFSQHCFLVIPCFHLLWCGCSWMPWYERHKYNLERILSIYWMFIIAKVS